MRENDHRYELTPGGRALEKVKKQMREETSLEPAPSNAKKKPPPVVSMQDWLNTTSAADPRERKLLFQSAARGEIKVVPKVAG
jgi:hypothetical protein